MSLPPLQTPPARATLALLAAVFVLCAGDARPRAAQAQAAAQAANAQASAVTVIKSQHRRLTFNQDIERLAVGDTEILSAELITSREILTLGRESGRTTLIVWFSNGASR